MDATDDTSARNRLEQAIECERRQLLQANAVLKCLYEVLLHAEGDDAVTYAEAACVATTLIDESLDRLDGVRLRPMIEALKRNADHAYPTQAADSPNNKVKEPRPLYLS